MALGWRIALAVGLVLALGAAGAALGLATDTGPGSHPSACSASAPKLTVTGTGMANGTPDLITLTLSVNATQPTAQSALSDDNKKAQAVTAALTSGGLAASDIQTANFTISPMRNNTGAITGYQVSNSIVAKLHDLTKAGAVIDAISAKGGDEAQIQNLSVSVEDTRSLEDQAHAQAVDQAGAHARAMAAAAGEHLAQVCSLTDTPAGSTVYNSPFASGLSSSTAQGAAAAGPSAPIEAGTEQLSANVTEVYALAPR